MLVDWRDSENIRKILEIVEKIYEIEHKKEKKYNLLIIWTGAKMATNDVTLNLTAPFGSNQAVPVETKNGQPFTFSPASIAWAVQDQTVATFVQNPDGSATFTPLKAGTSGVAVTDNSTGAVAQGTLTVAGSADSFAMSINWQVPAGGAAPTKALGQIK